MPAPEPPGPITFPEIPRTAGPLGDMPAEEFRAAGHALVEWIADYLQHAERYPVLAQVSPGEIARSLPAAAPQHGEAFGDILADVERVIVPGLTHWNSPTFFAYFSICASGPGVLADFLSSALNQQAMLWRTSPAATELEAVTLGWLRQLMGLPEPFEGVIYDTASVSTLHALAAARERALRGVRLTGLAGREDARDLRVYCSDQAH
jgi:aromatic-L-amino-acid decarboxylase